MLSLVSKSGPSFSQILIANTYEIPGDIYVYNKRKMYSFCIMIGCLFYVYSMFASCIWVISLEYTSVQVLVLIYTSVLISSFSCSCLLTKFRDDSCTRLLKLFDIIRKLFRFTENFEVCSTNVITIFMFYLQIIISTKHFGAECLVLLGPLLDKIRTI